jgi:hypothetical protein
MSVRPDGPDARPATNAQADPQALRHEVERLLQHGRDDEALELVAAACSHRAEWEVPSTLAQELRRIHFGGAAAAGPTPAATLGVTLQALRVAASLRPHARAALGVWERTLLRSALDHAIHSRR